jgi:hypothetical protein
MTGDFSTTAYALSSGGVPQKIGDATRTLVGMIYTSGTSTFSSTDGALFVRTFFNRFTKRSRGQFSADRSLTSTSFVEINTEIRNSFLVWANENVNFFTAGSFGINQANASAATQISFDGGAAEQETNIADGSEVGGGGGQKSSLAITGVKVGLSEGLHFVTLLGGVSTGTGTWYSSNTTTSGKVTLGVTVGT